MAAVFALLASLSALGGGVVALRNLERIHLLLGLTAGIVLGVVSFELLPEVFELAAETGTEPLRAMIALVVGFLTFHVLEKTLALHEVHADSHATHSHVHVDAGGLSALAIAAHSLADGVGIGLAAQASDALGLSVALAVIAHRFADGLNTVGVTQAHDHTTRQSFRWLLVVALAPVLGATATLFVTVGDAGLLLYLGFFAGSLLYLGASDVLPEAHSRHSSGWTVATTVLGVAAMLVLALVAGDSGH
jgi:ZIP family zinc transporter